MKILKLVMNNFSKILVVCLLLNIFSCIHSYDRVSTKKSDCLYFNKNANIINNICKLNQSGYLSITISKQSTNPNFPNNKYKSISKTIFSYNVDSTLPFVIPKLGLDTINSIIFQIWWRNKKYELELNIDNKTDSIYFFNEY